MLLILVCTVSVLGKLCVLGFLKSVKVSSKVSLPHHSSLHHYICWRVSICRNKPTFFLLHVTVDDNNSTHRSIMVTDSAQGHVTSRRATIDPNPAEMLCMAAFFRLMSALKSNVSHQGQKTISPLI